MAEYFLVAKIISAADDKGFLKIVSYSDYPNRFSKLKTVYIDFWGEKKKFSVLAVKRKKNSTYLKFKDFEEKKSAAALIGKEVYIDEVDLRKLPNGYYFIHDVIGCRVVHNGNDFGKVVDIYSLSANDVFVIKKVNGDEILIPAVSDFIEGIDTTNKVLTLKAGAEFYEDDED